MVHTGPYEVKINPNRSDPYEVAVVVELAEVAEVA